MKKIITAMAAFVTAASFSQAQVIISQYYEGSAGTNRVLELWNVGVSSVDLSVSNLLIENFFNGGAVANTLSITSGTIAAGGYFVITNLDTNGTSGFTAAGLTADFVATGNTGMNFNGDDALVISLGGVVVDSFGQKGVDPGSAWTSGSVSSANQNIRLLSGVTTGRTTPTDAFEIATRFEFVAAADNSAGAFAGFTPTAVPEPGTVALVGLGLGAVLIGLRRRKA